MVCFRRNLPILHCHSSNYFQNNFTDSLANASHKLIDISLHAFLAVFLSPIIAFFTLFSIHKFFAFGILVWTI